jgi:small subunit ribosomal protein S3Ae
MAAKKAKAASRKVKDKWKAKEWYKLYAPKMFNQMELGETPCSEPSALMGRTTEVTVHDLTGDFSKMHIKMKFRVDDVRGLDAHTVFVGHDLTSDYIRRLTRRKRTKTDHVMDVRTKDGFLVRIKPMSITEKRIQAAQETAIRELMNREAASSVANMTLSELVKIVISGELAKNLSRVCKVIVPIKRIEIRKTEVLEMGTPSLEEPSIQQQMGEEAKIQEAEEAAEHAAASVDQAVAEAAASEEPAEAETAEEEESAEAEEEQQE